MGLQRSDLSETGKVVWNQVAPFVTECVGNLRKACQEVSEIIIPEGLEKCVQL